jgi:hypothetical protein
VGSDNLLAQITGTFTVSFSPVDAAGDVIRVNAFNATSLTSAGHGTFDGPNELKPVEGNQPFGTIRQFYAWFESIPYRGLHVSPIESGK